MKRRLVLVTEIIAPYRIPVFNELAARDDMDLHVIFLSETDPTLRQWLVHKEEIRFSFEVLHSWRRRIGKYNLLLNHGTTGALRRAEPDAILCGGYNYLASWQTAHWARKHSVPLLLWSESTGADQRRGTSIVETLKRRFLSYCWAFVVPGRSSREYLHQFQIPDSRIFTAPNAMDLRFFAEASRRARQDPAAIRREFDLPDRYFLNVGRLVPFKGVLELLDAYANLDSKIRSNIGLVLVGDGVLKEQLAKQASQISPGIVRFPGFVQKDRLPDLYALADAFVFPTRSDTWGFVVNEAMACGLPVIATDVAGCVADLVQDGWNGYIVPTRDVVRLTASLSKLALSDELRRQMSDRSLERVAGYSPAAWAAGVAQAVAAVSK